MNEPLTHDGEKKSHSQCNGGTDGGYRKIRNEDGRNASIWMKVDYGPKMIDGTLGGQTKGHEKWDLPKLPGDLSVWIKDCK